MSIYIITYILLFSFSFCTSLQEIFDNASSAKDYEKKKDMAETEKEKKEITRKKWEKCESKTSIAKKVSDALGVNCNRKLVSSVLKKRSSQLDKLLKIK